MVYLVPVKRQRDAHGAYCLDCEMCFDVSSAPYWPWSKSVAMHRSAPLGHRVVLYRLSIEGRP